MTFILWYNNRHFNQALLSLILVTPLCVQLWHLSFVDCLFVFEEKTELGQFVGKVEPLLHQKTSFYKLLFDMCILNDEDFWVKH